VHQTGCGFDAVMSGTAALLGDDGRHIHAVLNQVLRADMRFGKVGVRSVAAGRNNGMRVLMLIQVVGVIEPGLQNRRRPAPSTTMASACFASSMTA
jgi:hypothetical protein